MTEDKDFLSLLDDTNSIKDETTGEIIVTVPLLTFDDEYKIKSPCNISSNCNTIIRCKLIEVLSTSVSFSNLTFESFIITDKANKFTMKNCKINGNKGVKQSILTINFSSNVSISDTTINLTSPMIGLQIDNNSVVNMDKVEICNGSETHIVIQGNSDVTIRKCHFHHTESNEIYSNGPAHIKITKSKIHDSAFPSIYLNNCHCIIKNNKFKNIKQNGISLNKCPLFELEDNTLTNIDASAVSITGGSFGYIKENTFTKINGNSVFSDFSEIEVTKNIVKNQVYPAFAIINHSIATIFDNTIEGTQYSGIALRNAKYAKIINNTILNTECGVSASNTDKALIENNFIQDCKISGIESYNHSNLFVKNNLISDMKNNAFLCYTSGFIKAENNIIENVEDSLVKLTFKGHGDFVDNKIKNCIKQCNNLTSSLYYFRGNGNFVNLTNDQSRLDDSMVFDDVKFTNDTVMCIKCKKNPRDCYLLDCGHKVYCRNCAEQALKDHENCPLCRFAIEKIPEIYQTNDEKTCTICLANEPDSIVLPCGHACFCSHCLDNWFKDNKVCPLCRAENASYKRIENDI